MNNLVLIGGGGHGKVVKDAALRTGLWRIMAVLDQKYKSKRTECEMIFGPESLASHFYGREDTWFFIAIGDNKVRKSIAERLQIPNEKYASIIHPAATIGSGVKIGGGTVVMPNAVINADSAIGLHCIVNTGAIIEHDNRIGDFVHLSPNSALAGGVKVHEGAHIGIGASAIPNIKIGEWSVLGAGAVAVKDVPGGATAVGVPAKPIKFQ